MSGNGRASRPVTAGRFLRVLALGLAVAVLCVAAALAVGEPIDIGSVLSGGGSANDRFIFHELRVPRVLAAAAVGGALALSGAAFQALLRNPLAEPYLLGISGGGAFGAVLAIVTLGASLTAPMRGGAALAGCLLALGIVYLIATRGGALHPATLLLAGVVTNAFFLAGLSLVQFAASPTEAQAVLRWVMGGFTAPGPGELAMVAVLALGGAVVLVLQAGRLNLLSFGEETARHLGVDVARTRGIVFVVTSLVVAASVAVAGPIGFVGLFVPHAARFVVGNDQRVLLPASFLLGAGFLPLADALARTVLAPRELPVGVVTAVIGAPAFVLLLLRHRGRHGGMNG